MMKKFEIKGEIVEAVSPFYAALSIGPVKLVGTMTDRKTGQSIETTWQLHETGELFLVKEIEE